LEGVAHLVSGAVEGKSDEKVPRKVLSLSRYMPYFVVVGCFLDIFSTFLPWSEDFGLQWFLPFSVALPVGWNVSFIESSYVLAVSVAVRLAAAVGLVGLLFHEYSRRLLAASALLVSIGLSFGSVIVFSQVGWALYWGAYCVIFGGLLKVAGLISGRMQIEIGAEVEKT
jgi:hypothetical protein